MPPSADGRPLIPGATADGLPIGGSPSSGGEPAPTWTDISNDASGTHNMVAPAGGAGYYYGVPVSSSKNQNLPLLSTTAIGDRIVMLNVQGTSNLGGNPAGADTITHGTLVDANTHFISATQGRCTYYALGTTWMAVDG